MLTQEFIKIFFSVQELAPFSLFQRQNLDQFQMSFDNLIGYILSISMCMQNLIIKFFTVKEIGPLSLFQKLENVSLQSLGLDLVNTNTKLKFFTVKEIGPLSLFQKLENVSLQSLGLDFVNTNVYAKVYQNIPHSSRDRAIFTFSEFGTRQSLNR